MPDLIHDAQTRRDAQKAHTASEQPPGAATRIPKRIRPGLVNVAIRLAADAPTDGGYRSHPQHERTLVKRSLIEELRRELDQAGLGDDWRALNRLIRAEERRP